MSGAQASRRGRRPQYARREAGQATPSVVAVVSVVAIVVALVAFFAGADESAVPQGQRDDVVADAAAKSARAAEPRSPAPTAARTPRREKPDTAERGNRADRKDKKDKRRKRRPRPEPETGPPEVYIEVYNNTSISGLAASTAAELQDAGWQVVGVDNWYGDIPSSTVYHPDGLEGEADQLAEELGIERVRGAVAPMKFDRLTVILTGDTS